MNPATALSIPIESEVPLQVQRAIDKHRVVLVVSPITDIGLVTDWLARHGQDYCRLELSMRSSASRAEFEQLRRVTRWRSLPQIFIDGEFIGGIQQFFEWMEQSGSVASSKAAAVPDGRWARRLGYAGLIPFVALSIIALLAPVSMADWAARALIAYAAVILSFVGALHWTRGLETPDTADAARLLGVSVLPALVGWSALLLPVHLGLILLAAGFGLLYAYDRRAWRVWPWFLSLRSQLTAGAMGSLLLAWLAGSG